MYWDVVDISPIATREWAVRFADGLSGTIRMDLSFCTGVFESLRSDDMVKQAMIEAGVVSWPNGLDLAPDTMYRKIKNSPDRCYVLT